MPVTFGVSSDIVFVAASSAATRRLFLSALLVLASSMAFAVPTAQAQLLRVDGNGETIANEGLKEPTKAVQGIAPRLFSMVSIQGGDVGGGHMEASLTGSGSADFGTLKGRLDAQARNAAPFQNLNEPSAVGFMSLGFSDSAVVFSSTLAIGTPISLEFTASLGASASATGPRTFRSRDNLATAQFEATITGPGGTLGSASIVLTHLLVPPSPTKTFTVATAVGERLRFFGDMRLNIGAVALLTTPGGGDSLSTSSVLAENTAHFYYTPKPGVTLISDSGHDYDIALASVAAPEPATLALVGMGLLAPVAGAVMRRRRRF